MSVNLEIRFFHYQSFSWTIPCASLSLIFEFLTCPPFYIPAFPEHVLTGLSCFAILYCIFLLIIFLHSWKAAMPVHLIKAVAKLRWQRCMRWIKYYPNQVHYLFPLPAQECIWLDLHLFPEIKGRFDTKENSDDAMAKWFEETTVTAGYQTVALTLAGGRLLVPSQLQTSGQ